MGRSIGLALAGCALLAVAPVARADEDANLQDRIRQLEEQVLDLRGRLETKDAGPLSAQVDRYLQEEEKGSLWVDRGGKPLAKAIDSAWVTMRLRFRPTWSKNLFDLTDGVDDEGFMTAQRHRLGVGANLHEGLAAFVELDMVGTFGNSSSAYANDAGFTITPTVQQAYIDGLWAKQLGGKTRLGRFEMSYGDEYAIGDRDFFQAGLAFDGARYSTNCEGTKFSADLIAAKLVDGYKNGTNPSPDDSVYLLGIYGNYYGMEGSTGLAGGFEPYYLVVKDQADPRGVGLSGTRDVHTLGVYWYGDKATKDQAGFGWNVNLSGQYFGDMFWGTDTRLMYTMSDAKWTPKVFGQFAYASGDSDGPGGAGYNPLFMDGHGRFGYSDLVGFSNLMLFGVGVQVSPCTGTTAGVEFRSDHIARTYSGGGNGKNLAWETDLVVKHKYSENVDLEAAYALVHWRDTLNTGGADDVQVAYVNVVLSF
jgi:hypothetical protein